MRLAGESRQALQRPEACHWLMPRVRLVSATCLRTSGTGMRSRVLLMQSCWRGALDGIADGINASRR